MSAIVLGFGRLGGNTLTECEAIDTFLANAAMCQEQMQCNFTLDCNRETTATVGNADFMGAVNGSSEA